MRNAARPSEGMRWWNNLSFQMTSISCNLYSYFHGLQIWLSLNPSLPTVFYITYNPQTTYLGPPWMLGKHCVTKLEFVHLQRLGIICLPKVNAWALPLHIATSQGSQSKLWMVALLGLPPTESCIDTWQVSTLAGGMYLAEGWPELHDHQPPVYSWDAPLVDWLLTA